MAHTIAVIGALEFASNSVTNCKAFIPDSGRFLSDPQAMRRRRGHPFGIIKARMGATHFLMKRMVHHGRTTPGS
jgi:hypothetical protein